MDLLLLCLPWIVVWVLTALLIRLPRPVSRSEDREEAKAPFLSVIIPARNEELNIGACLSSLVASTYPAFEIIVVDDESTDSTPSIVETTPRGNARDLRLIRGEPLPEGWFGKPWACHQGSNAANGDLFLFTDADTIHGPSLLGDAVLSLFEEESDLLTLMGRQRMGSFWEQLLQPQFFMLLVTRFPRAGQPKRRDQWKHAIANGQYLLFWKDAYEAMGGHESVRGEVAEDLRLAQLLVRGGWTMAVRGAEQLETRMYRSLGGLVEGWSKNVATAALQTTARWLLPVILPLSLLVGVVLWWVPPFVLAWFLFSGQGGTLLSWAALTTAASAVYWGFGSFLLKGNPLFGLLYPLGSLMAAFIFVKSWVGGTRITWKDRTYEMPREARLGS